MSEKPVKITDKDASNTNNNNGIFEYLMWWKLDQREVQEQVTNYLNLRVTKSFRGIASLLILGSCVITLITSLIDWFPLDNLYGLILYLPLALLVYKGKRWAIVIMMVLWTLEKALSISASFPSTIITLTWWALYMRFLYGALKVENIRIKDRKIKGKSFSDQTPYTPKTSSKNLYSLISVIVLCSAVIGGIYINHTLQLQRQKQQQEYEKQLQLEKEQENKRVQQENYELEKKRYWEQVELQGRLDNIESSLQEQENESNNQRNCEANNGRYMGNGTCVFY